MGDVERIMERVRRLLAIANDPAASDNEQRIALEQAQRLMDRHAIEEWQLEEDHDDVEIIERRIRLETNPCNRYMAQLANIVAHGNRCRAAYECRRAGNGRDVVSTVWIYGARVDGEVYFDATNETVTEESDRTVTTTDHYDAYRKGNISFKRVPVDGSSKMPDGHMDAIEPFDYDALRPFSVAYMPGYIANRYDEDCETCKARAERRMEESTISALRETVVDEYDDATVESKQLDYTWEDSDYALFPVWMLSTSWNGKSYLFAMNGQTGRLVGELPCSKPKLAIASVLFFVIGFVLSQILFMGENAFDPDYLTFDIEGILINIIAPLIIVIIGDVLLVGQLKTANEATCADEYCGELDLTEKHDTFSHRTTKQSNQYHPAFDEKGRSPWDS